LKTKLIAAAGSLVLVGSLAAAAAPTAGAAAPPPVNVQNHKLKCDTLTGSLKFVPPLTLGGTSPGSITLNSKLDGCTDLTDNTISVKAAVTKGILNSATNDCLGLLGLSAATTGTVTSGWAANTGTPKIDDGDAGNAGKTESHLQVGQTYGGTFNNTAVGAPAADQPALNKDSWGASYGFFRIGGNSGTSAPTITGAFTGGDNGNTTTFDGTTGQDVGATGTMCFSATGIKALVFGIGGVTLQ